jgi:hypothetical protein
MSRRDVETAASGIVSPLSHCNFGVPYAETIARVLRLTVPPMLLGRADVVIESALRQIEGPGGG